MKVIFGIAFLVVLGIAIFAVQNSNAPPVMTRLLFWNFETSLVYEVLGSVVLGILFTLLFWIPWTIRAYLQKKRHSPPPPNYGPS
jgi:uncharacterized integral membrane protein